MAAEIAERGGSALALVCDVNELDDIQACVDRTVEHFGTVDILVNNAQQVPHGHLLEVSDEACIAAWTSGALASIRFHAALPPLPEGRRSHHQPGLGVEPQDRPQRHGGVRRGEVGHPVDHPGRRYGMGADGIRAITLMPVAMSPAMEDWKGFNPEGFARAPRAVRPQKSWRRRDRHRPCRGLPV